MEIQITAIKFEMVNGKKTGKSFAFKMDPKKMAIYKTEATLRKKLDEYVAKSGVFKKEELKSLKYSMKDFLEEWKKQIPVVEAEELVIPQFFMKVPDSLFTEGHTVLLQKEHLAEGFTLKGKSMSGLAIMGEYVKEFCEFAKKHQEKHFLVTPIGCGIAGFHESEVAPLFEICRDVKNISLPASFWYIIGGPSPVEYDLDRFLIAQEANYNDALDEIRAGRKTGHWIWYIFPQQKGLGRSYNSQYYGLDGIDEARAYLVHPVLGARLREISEALLSHKDKRDIDAIMGSSIDVLKLQTCMNLFNRVSPNDIFEKVLDAFF